MLKNVPTKVQIFPGQHTSSSTVTCLLCIGTVHGFCCRPALGIPKVKAAFESAFEESVAWFQSHL